MGSHFYEFTTRNRWVLLIALICVIFIALASYSIEEDRKNILANMESQTNIEALHISMGLSAELDEVIRDLLVIYDVKKSSPPHDQDEFSFKAKPLLKKYPFLSSICYIDTEQNLILKISAGGNDLSAAYKDNSQILDIAMLVAKHTDKPYLSKPYEVTSGNYQYSLMVPYEEY